MFERYTEAARRVLFFARYECSELGATTIETEHLLLGLVREPGGIVPRVLDTANVTLEQLRRVVEAGAEAKPKFPTSVEIPFAEDVRRVLEFAAEEADRLRHSYIAPEHLLLAMLREERSFAAGVLTRRGITLAAARDTVREIGGEGGESSVAAPGTAVTLIADVEGLTHQLAEAQPGSEHSTSLVNQIHVLLGRLRGLLGQ